MTLQPSHPSFIRAAWRPLAAGIASLALCACLHYITPPPPAPPEAADLSCRLPALAPLAENYTELADTVVPPRTHQQVQSCWPPIGALHDNAMQAHHQTGAVERRGG